MTSKSDPWPEHCRRRLIAAILDAADLFPHSGEDSGTRIHDSRKALKEARAAARLFAVAVGPPAYEAVSALESARRQLGRARDLDVMPAALASLGTAIDAETSARLARAIAFEREVARHAHRNIDVAAEIARLRELARSIEAWEIAPEVTTTQLLKALRVAYRAARRHGRRALARSDAHELHQLRAQIVDLGHHFAALEAAWPALFAAIGAEFQRMRQSLGEHNDLTVLAEFAVGSRDLSLMQMTDLALKVERRQKQLTRRARKQFERLFAERPSALERRLAAYLEYPKTRMKEES
ncbi:CHAD domain-containing protein [Methylocapsa sp. S129]|uniref:CHAD domain-containing protein n=1 Tax=Methylocapsa sp. S129 TaxID=1641869 RepID=UPI00131B3BE5|nr:CHAD domain-containing protein [Methylocapsa sp. S129]